MGKWIVLGLFLLLFFLLWSRITVLFYYNNGEYQVKIKYLFYRRILLPAPEKKTKKPKRTKKAVPADEQQKEKPKKKLSETIETVLDFLRPLPDAVKYLLKKLTVAKIDIYMRVAEQDAAETAISYGRTCAVVYGALAALRNIFKIDVKAIKIEPDFFDGKEETIISGQVGIRLYAALACVIRYLAAYFRNMLGEEKQKESLVPKKD